MAQAAIAENSTGRLRNWFFTLNIGTLVDGVATMQPWYQEIEQLHAMEGIKGYVYQVERGEEGNNIHYQGYVEFTRAVYFHEMQTALPHAHLMRRIATRTDVINYCSKEESRYWFEGAPWPNGPTWFPDEETFRGTNQGNMIIYDNYLSDESGVWHVTIERVSLLNDF